MGGDPRYRAPKRARSERPATAKRLHPRHRRRGGRSVRGAAAGVDPRYRAPKRGSIRASRNPEGARSATPATRGSIRPGRRRGGRSAISSPQMGLDPSVPQPRGGSIHGHRRRGGRSVRSTTEGVDPRYRAPKGARSERPATPKGLVSRGREKWTEMGSEKWTLFGLGFRGCGEGRDGSGAPRRSSRPATPTPPGGEGPRRGLGRRPSGHPLLRVRVLAARHRSGANPAAASGSNPRGPALATRALRRGFAALPAAVRPSPG